jgi:hypothetical protein
MPANTEKAVDVLVEIMLDTKASRRTRIVAVNAILDRAYGKPPQTLLTPDTPVWEQPVNTLELARRIACILEHAKRAGADRELDRREHDR